ncbi:MAG TPA: ABC transporter substrate-binding protein [Gemmatimonadaceae bacterium]|nr:ABC transporter substrate-binding protein [Gemmatimonadaceae bacterium]
MSDRSVGRYARRGGAIVATSAALALASIAAGDRTPTQPPERIVTLGGVFALSGSGSSYGLTARAAMELAVEDVNRELGRNVLGLRFATSFEDSRRDPALAVEKARTLRARGVQLLIGGQTSAEVAPLKAYVDENGMLLVSPSSTAGSLAIAGDNVFRFTPSDSLEAVAITTMMWEDGVRAIVPVWHDDPSANDLVAAVRSRIAGLGGSVLAGVRYGAPTEFTTITSDLRRQVDDAARRFGRGSIGIYFTGFDEVVRLFAAASEDPVLGSIHWYGSDAGVLPEELLARPVAAKFAARVGYPNPIVSLDPDTRDHWQPILQRIRERSTVPVSGFDAYTLAVYDAVWVAAKAYVTVGASPRIDDLKQAFTTAAATHFGATGWTALNAAGDRNFGNFDFWAMRETDGALRWTRVAFYETRTQRLVRFDDRGRVVSLR